MSSDCHMNVINGYILYADTEKINAGIKKICQKISESSFFVCIILYI